MGLKIGMLSLGCDKNRVDAEVMLSRLSKNGYEIINDEKKADIIIVNTCAFIESAKEESIKTIIEMAQNKKNGKCRQIIVTGCLAERYKEELQSAMPEIDAIVGLNDAKDICNIIRNNSEGEALIENTKEINYNLNYEERILTTPSHYAYIKIAEGCNNNCSFCIIPKIRGKFRSRSMESIISEADQLAASGIKELILVAQDTTMYGIDIYGKQSLPELLKKLEKIEGIKWIRIMYFYPEEITQDLIKTIKNSKKICHYFDMAIQHISNNILYNMGRRGRKEDIISNIQLIKAELPDAVIRTSLIVGFPGESDKDFNELKDFLNEYKLDRVGVFTYSREENTRAFNMKNQISEKVKIERKNEIMKLQSIISEEKNSRLINKVINVIIDGKDEKEQYYGRTYGDAPEIDQEVYINSDSNCKLKTGDIVKVKVLKAYTYDLLGVVEYESCK